MTALLAFAGVCFFAAWLCISVVFQLRRERREMAAGRVAQFMPSGTEADD